MQIFKGCICSIFLQREFSNVLSNGLPQQMHSRITYICSIFFSSARFQMDPPIISLNRCKVKLIAFVPFFSRMNFQMCSQIVCSNIYSAKSNGQVFFSSVSFQMGSQISRLNRCKVTLVAFVKFFSSEFSNVFSNYLPEQMQSHIGCICMISLQSEFSYRVFF